MRYNQLFVSILVVISLLLVSCGSSDQAQTTTTGPYIGGTTGVVANFEPLGVEEDGVFTIFDSETFPLELTLVNKGEHTLQAGDVVVKMLGPSPEEFSGIPSDTLSNSDVIEGISDLVPNGGEETVSFASDAKYEPNVDNYIDRQWFANIEYNYQTQVLIPEVCLKADQTDERVCDVVGPKTFFVSGAPITVKAVQEDRAGKGIMVLSFKVSKEGAGKVTKQGEEFSIRDELTYSLDDPSWECKSSGKVNEARLINGEAEILCKLSQALPEGSTPATKQVTLTLSYKYRDIVQETIRIKESAK